MKEQTLEQRIRNAIVKRHNGRNIVDKAKSKLSKMREEVAKQEKLVLELSKEHSVGFDYEHSYDPNGENPLTIFHEFTDSVIKELESEDNE